MVKRDEDRWGSLQGALHGVAPLVVDKANKAQWEKWLEVPLELACRAGQDSLVEKLLAAGADAASSRYELPLIHSAVLGNNPRVVAALMDAGCEDDEDTRASSAWLHRTPLHMAVWRRKTTMAKALLEVGADAAAVDAKGLTPLHLASIRADVPMMRRILAIDGVDMEARTTAGLTPLYIGLCNRQVGSVAFLLGAGADMVSPPHMGLFEVDGRSCLFTAAEKGYNEMIGILIDAGADVHERIDGWSVMCAAARGQRVRRPRPQRRRSARRRERRRRSALLRRREREDGGRGGAAGEGHGRRRQDARRQQDAAARRGARGQRSRGARAPRPRGGRGERR